MAFEPIIHRHIGKFIELPRDHVNAYIVELENSAVIIDATLAISSSQELRNKAESLGKPIEAVLMTHGHPDHYGGLKQFADLPILASQGCLEFAQREDVTKNATASYLLGEDWPAERAFPNQIIKDNDSFTFGGTTFTFRDLGPGESDSDGMWLIESNGVTHAFVGDSAANRTHCFFRDGHTAEWLQILDRLERDFNGSTRLYVGHGDPTSDLSVIEWQRRYIKTFLDAVTQLEDRSVPVTEDAMNRITHAMKSFHSGDDLLFLMQYELDVTLSNLFRQQSRSA